MSDPDAKDASDYKWLVARERGDDISHVLAMDRAPYEQLGRIIGARTTPSPGWRQRVLEAIDAAKRAEHSQPAAEAAEPVAAPTAVATEPTAVAAEIIPAKPTATGEPADLAPVVPIESRRWRTRWIAGGFAAAAAAAALVYVVRPPPTEVPPDEKSVIAMETQVTRGATVTRADPTRTEQASVGDTLVVRAEVTGPAELRVYGGSGERLIAQCDDRAGCSVDREGERRRFSLEVPLTTPGTVRAVIFVGKDLPPSTRSLTSDLEAAAGAKIPVVTRTPTRVL